jgi:hypothetical protein
MWGAHPIQANPGVPAWGQRLPAAGHDSAPRPKWLQEVVDNNPNIDLADVADIQPWQFSKNGHARGFWHVKMVADLILWPTGTRTITAEYEVKWKKWERKNVPQKLVKVAKETPKTLLAIPLFLLMARGCIRETFRASEKRAKWARDHPHLASGTGRR